MLPVCSPSRGGHIDLRCHVSQAGLLRWQTLSVLTLAQVWNLASCGTAAVEPPHFIPAAQRRDGLGLLWFGANVSGPDSVEQLEFIHRHALVGYGWQQSINHTACRHAETALAQAISRLAAAQDAQSKKHPQQRFVYRNMMSNWVMFDVMRDVARHVPASGGIFMRDLDNSPNAPVCTHRPQKATTEPLTMPLVFKATPQTAQYYLKEVVAELITESDLSAVFFDETDWSACGYDFAALGCHNISDQFRVDDLLAKLPLIRDTAKVLNTAGLWPIFSSKNVLEAAWQGLPSESHRPCLLPHDPYFAALANVSYARFYEYWLGVSADFDAALIANALLEARSGVGLVLRTLGDHTASCPGGATPSIVRHATNTKYAAAGALIVHNNYSYWGISTGWHDQDWCWHPEYDLIQACGRALSTAVRTGVYTWRRAFKRCDVYVNTRNATGVIAWR